MENILEKAGGILGGSVVNTLAITSAGMLIVSGRGSAYSMASAFSVYATIKRLGDLNGKQIGKNFDIFIKEKYGIDVDKFVNDNIKNIDNKIKSLSLDTTKILNTSEHFFNDLNDYIKDKIDVLSYFFNPLDLRYRELSIALKNTNTTLDNFSSSSSITLYDPLSLDLNNDGVISTTNLENINKTLSL